MYMEKLFQLLNMMNHNLIIENCNRFLVYVVETGNCLGWVSKEAISVININENGDVSYENI